ncbi:ferredoxin [Pseudogracilibacillus auburnensis]|uniref:Ferredoxin n=1 Tax=Pseudogracilibacillus auburnensis TaxID=1494959 RepID=A0A2V3VW51_9BACI|nr:ferredoxin [Pseudogracilibacillus auburnensis]
MVCKYTIVNQDTCISCGSCGAIAPDIFAYDDAGLSYFIGDDNVGNIPVDEDVLFDLEDAHDECPTGSIKVSNEPFNGDPLKEAFEQGA